MIESLSVCVALKPSSLATPAIDKSFSPAVIALQINRQWSHEWIPVTAMPTRLLSAPRFPGNSYDLVEGEVELVCWWTGTRLQLRRLIWTRRGGVRNSTEWPGHE